MLGVVTIFKIQISPTGKIYTGFYRKPTTRNLFIHFKSALPLSAKKKIYIRNKVRWIPNRCSEKKDKNTHTAHLKNTLRTNDYPTSILKINKKKLRKLHTPSNTCFLKLPHFSKMITKEIRRVIYKEGLDIQLAYSGPSLRQYLTKKNNNTVTTCSLANSPIKESKYMAKNLLYRVER